MIRRIRNREEGEALVLVMLISMLVLMLLATASVTLLNQYQPTSHSVATGQAYAAAEAGIEDFTTKINANCPDATSLSCSWLSTGLTSNPQVTDPKSQTGTVLTAADGSTSSQAFDWTVRYAASGFARVVSVGQALGSAGKPTMTKTLVADLGATPTFDDFEYFTKFETFPADFVNSFYPARNVDITSSSAASGSTLTGPGVLKWNGTCTYISATATPTCDPSHDTGVCNDLYYPSDNGPGRGTDAAWNNTLRRPSSAVEQALGTDNTFAYYSEQGTFMPSSGGLVPETHNDVCDSSFEPNMVMNGPIYSQDAYLIDRGKDTGTSKNSMPIFNGNAYSMWNGVINGVQQAKGVNQGYDRPYPNTDGQISTTLSPEPVYTTDKLDLPANANGAQGLATCTYTGPTRILIKQNIAYITSPETPTSPAPTGPSYCYTSTGSFANPSGGVANAQVPTANTLIYVKNPSSGTPRLATASNPIFDLTASTPMPSTTTLSDTLAGTWTDNSTYSPTAQCPSPANPLKRRNFDCEANNTRPAPDIFTAIKNAVEKTLTSAATSASNVQTNVTSAIKATFSPAAILSPPTNWTANNYYYKVTVSNPTYSTQTTTPASLNPADSFYQASSSGSFTTQLAGASVSIDRMTCSSPKSNGSCNVALTDTPIVTGSATGRYVTGTPVSATSSWPWFGSTGSYTDPNNDVTPYYDGYGDVYVQGTLKGSMSIIAEHDIVITNDLTYNNTNLNTTTDGLALIADHNVRIYRPMTCTDNDPSNSTGFLNSQGNVLPRVGVCPDDLTGVFSTPLAWPLPTNYPSTKYVPDNAPSLTNGGLGNIYATIFALRGCFMVDNFYRGAIGYSANIYGGLYQYHRGPTSLPYQGRPYQGSTTKMPGVVLNYNFDNMRAGQNVNGGLRVPWIPNPVGRPSGSTRTWNVTTVSTGT
jgi:Tfp pilus assembly protein PilX